MQDSEPILEVWTGSPRLSTASAPSTTAPSPSGGAPSPASSALTAPARRSVQPDHRLPPPHLRPHPLSRPAHRWPAPAPYIPPRGRPHLPDPTRAQDHDRSSKTLCSSPPARSRWRSEPWSCSQIAAGGGGGGCSRRRWSPWDSPHLHPPPRRVCRQPLRWQEAPRAGPHPDVRPAMILLDEPGAGVNRVLMQKLVETWRPSAARRHHLLRHRARYGPRHPPLQPGDRHEPGRTSRRRLPRGVKQDERVLEAYLGGQYR